MRRRLNFYLSFFALSLLFSGNLVAAPKIMGFVKRVKGDATLIRQDKIHRVETNMKIFNKDRIKTDSKAMVHLIIGKNNLFVAKNSELIIDNVTIDDKKRGKKRKIPAVKMLYGKLRASAGGKKTKYHKLFIRTSTSVAGVRGTNLEITVAKDGATGMLALDGSINSLELIPAHSGPPIPVPVGMYSYAAPNAEVMPAKVVDGTQFDRLNKYFDGEKHNVAYRPDGTTFEVGFETPAGMPSADAPDPAGMLVNGERVPTPPKGFELRSNGLILPVEETKIMVGANGPIPIVLVPPTPAEVNRARLIQKPGYLKKMKAQFVEAAKLMRAKQQYIRAKISGDNASAEKFQKKISRIETRKADLATDLTRIEKKNMEQKIRPQIEREIRQARKSGDTQKVQQLQHQQQIANREIQQLDTKIEIIDVQKQMYAAQAEAGIKTDGELNAQMEKIKSQMANLSEIMQKIKQEVLHERQALTQESIQTIGREFAKYMGPRPGDGGPHSTNMEMMISSADGAQQFKVEVQVAAHEGPPGSEPRYDPNTSQGMPNLGEGIFQHHNVSDRVILAGNFGPMGPGMPYPGMGYTGIDGMPRDPSGLYPELTLAIMEEMKNYCEQNPTDSVCSGGGPEGCMPGDPSCAFGPPMDFCASNPNDPACAGGPGMAHCQANPSDPACIGLGHELGMAYCEQNPGAPECGGFRDPEYCIQNPWDCGGGHYGPDCSLDPTMPGCNPGDCANPCDCGSCDENPYTGQKTPVTIQVRSN